MCPLLSFHQSSICPHEPKWLLERQMPPSYSSSWKKKKRNLKGTSPVPFLEIFLKPLIALLFTCHWQSLVRGPYSFIRGPVCYTSIGILLCKWHGRLGTGGYLVPLANWLPAGPPSPVPCACVSWGSTVQWTHPAPHSEARIAVQSRYCPQKKMSVCLCQTSNSGLTVSLVVSCFLTGETNIKRVVSSGESGKHTVVSAAILHLRFVGIVWPCWIGSRASFVGLSHSPPSVLRHWILPFWEVFLVLSLLWPKALLWGFKLHRLFPVRLEFFLEWHFSEKSRNLLVYLLPVSFTCEKATKDLVYVVFSLAFYFLLCPPT